MLRYLLVACLVLTGCSTTKQAYIDHPVRVTGEGRTFEEAKKNAFSNAMEYAVGAVVVTETQVQNKRLTKDDIIKHSSGYVDDYTIVNQINEPNHVTLILDVKVKSSAIAERITNVKTATGEIQGERVGTLHSSFMQTRQSGDNLLSAVLDSYPKNAFNIEKGKVEYMMNVHREPVIIAHYKIRWNYKYLKALNEVLASTQDPRDRSIKQARIDVQSKDPDAWFLGQTDTYYFNDEYRANLITSALRRTVFIHFAYKDASGNVVKYGCDDGRVINGVFQNGAFVIEGNEVIDENEERTIKVNAHKIRTITTIDISLDTRACTNIN